MNSRESSEATVPSQQPEPECCDGCGDTDPEFWMGGAWYCYSCASCTLCGHPYCKDPSHEW